MVGDGWGKEEPPRPGLFNCGDAGEDTVGVRKGPPAISKPVYCRAEMMVGLEQD